MGVVLPVILSEEFMKKLGVSGGCPPLVEVVHVELNEGGCTCLMKEARLACLK